jgi:hypothetical protein
MPIMDFHVSLPYSDTTRYRDRDRAGAARVCISMTVLRQS